LRLRALRLTSHYRSNKLREQAAIRLQDVIARIEGCRPECRSKREPRRIKKKISRGTEG